MKNKKLEYLIAHAEELHYQEKLDHLKKSGAYVLMLGDNQLVSFGGKGDADYPTARDFITHEMFSAISFESYAKLLGYDNFKDLLRDIFNHYNVDLWWQDLALNAYSFVKV